MSNWLMTLTLDWNNTQGNFQSSSWLKDGNATNPPSGNNPAQVGDTINWCVQALNLPSGGYLSQLVVTVGKFQGGNDGTLGSPFQTGGGHVPGGADERG